MKRTEIVALSRETTRRVMTEKAGVVAPTKKQLEKLAEHKRKKGVGKQPSSHRIAAG